MSKAAARLNREKMIKFEIFFFLLKHMMKFSNFKNSWSKGYFYLFSSHLYKEM